MTDEVTRALVGFDWGDELDARIDETDEDAVIDEIIAALMRGIEAEDGDA